MDYLGEGKWTAVGTDPILTFGLGSRILGLLTVGVETETKDWRSKLGISD